MLFETLTGHLPYDRPTELREDARPPQRSGAVAPRRGPGRPAALDAIVAKAMAKRPEDRFARAAELGAALGLARSPEIELGETARSERRRLPRRTAGRRRRRETAARRPRAPRDPRRPPAAAPARDRRAAADDPPHRADRRRAGPARAAVARGLLVAVAIVAIAIVASGGGGEARRASPTITGRGSRLGHSSTSAPPRVQLVGRRLGRRLDREAEEGQVARVTAARDGSRRCTIGGSPTRHRRRPSPAACGSAAPPAELERLVVGSGTSRVAMAPLSSAPSAIALRSQRRLGSGRPPARTRSRISTHGAR